MCGLFGVMSAWLAGNEVDTVKQLGLLSFLRGQFGAGVVGIPTSPKKDLTILRSDTHVVNLMYGGAFNKGFYDDKARHSVIMGHARFPTKGGWDLSDTHPVVEKHIVGMHNGTIKTLAGKKIKDDEHDSRLLFEDIALKGVDATLKGIDGAYALVWVDKRAETISFLRNSQRPLYFGYYDGSPGTVYWASEFQMLDFVLHRENVKDEIIIKALPVDTLLTFRARPSGTINPLTIRKLAPEVTLPFDPPYVQETKETPAMEIDGIPPSIMLSGMTTHTTNDGELAVMTQPSRYIRWSTLQTVLKGGCTNCNVSATTDDYVGKKLSWVAPTEFLCELCLKSDKFAQDYAKSHGFDISTIYPDENQKLN